jgi:hypothetical protein
MTAESASVHGSATKVVERAASDAAFQIVKAGRDVVSNGRRDAVWRARPDGVVEVARGEWGRVELYEVHDDAIARLIATSPRSIAKVLSTLCAYASAIGLVVGVVGAMILGGGPVLAVAALPFILLPLSFLLRWKSNVRPWIRQRFGADDDWADVPWELEGDPPTGSQAIALTLLARTSTVRYRVLEDSNLEVVVRAGKEMNVLSLDRAGDSTITESLPAKRFKLEELRGEKVTWHKVVETDPTD